MPHRILEEAGLFTFSEARTYAEPILQQVVAGRLDSNDFGRYLDLAMLTAAEVTLVPVGPPGVRIAPVEPPVLVTSFAAQVVLQKWDSTPTWPHIPNRDDVRPWDVMFFAGDMSKAARVTNESVAGMLASGGFGRLVAALKNQYRTAGNSLASDVSDSRVLDFLGVIWHAKSSVLLDPAGADDSVRVYLERDFHLELT